MKTIISCVSFISIVVLITSCDNAKGRYVDLNTGDKVELKKDPETGLMVNAETNKPVTLYVDTKTKDTIYGKTGKVVNGKIIRRSGGTYVYETDASYGAKSEEYKVKHGDYKKEVEKDGDITIKDGDKKIKIDGETGERKVKND